MSWLPKKTVLVPTDFSEPSLEAIRTATEMVEHNSDVHVLHILPPLSHTAPGVLFGDLDDDTRREKATQHLGDFLNRNELTDLTATVFIGDPGLEISEYAKQQQVDLIVMPSHGHHGLRRILLGSVAERVLRHAECPVLVLRRCDHD